MQAINRLVASDGSAIEELEDTERCRLFQVTPPGTRRQQVIVKHFSGPDHPLPDDLAAALAWMLQPARGDRSRAGDSGAEGIVVCGVDTESSAISRGSPLHAVQLVQLCVGSRAVIIERSTGLLGCSVMRAFFRNAAGAVVFTGAELAGDAILLLADGMPMHGCIDLTPTYSALEQAEKAASGAARAADVRRGDGSPSPHVRLPPDPDAVMHLQGNCGGRVTGLRRMFERWFGVSWEKRASVTCSNWGAALSLEQIKYAALDAWVSAQMGWHALESWGSQV